MITEPEESNADPGGHRGEGSKIEGIKKLDHSSSTLTGKTLARLLSRGDLGRGDLGRGRCVMF